MNSNKKQFDSAFVIFLTIAALYAIGNFIWWQINTPIIPISSTAVHFMDIFSDGYLYYNAPLLTWIMKGMFFIFGKEYYDLIAVFVGYIFFLIPLYFIYKIGVELKDKETGNIAMILFALVPAVYGMSRQYGHQDYHIIAPMTFNIYCLIKTDYFKNMKWTIFYGISVGLGLMIKDTFLAFFFAPYVYITVVGLREKPDKAKIINILMATILGSLIAGWHYFRNTVIMKIIQEPIMDRYSIFAFDNFRVMTIGLWEELLAPPIFILFVIGLVFFIRRYRGAYKNIILLWFIIPWAIIMAMPQRKLPEHGACLIPAMILICAVFISNVRNKYKKNFILIFLIIIGCLQYIDFSYVSYIKFFDMGIKIKKYFVGYYNRYNNLVSCDKKQTDLVLKLVKYLNCHYPDHTFYIDDRCILLDTTAILFQMFLNNSSYRQWQYSTEDVLSSDIIVIIGKPQTPEEAAWLKLKKISGNPSQAKMVTHKFKNELSKQVENMFNEIKKNYEIIDVFHLDESKNEDTKVTLLSRKDKFPKFNGESVISETK
jgi:hypothetical protein